MPIRFRCQHCGQLMSIATRKAGCDVPCPRCRQPTRVPDPFVSEKDPAEAVDDSAGTNVAASPPIESPAVKSPVPHSETQVTDAEESSEIRFRRRTAPMDEMDLTPMVDMTFLLLIFFMVTASFSQQKTLQVPPPDSDKKGATQSIEEIQEVQEASIRISIDSQNVIRVEDEVLGNPGGLAEILREKMRQELKSEAMVEIAPEAFHETVVRVVDACNEAGIQKIRLGARRDSR